MATPYNWCFWPQFVSLWVWVYCLVCFNWIVFLASMFLKPCFREECSEDLWERDRYYSLSYKGAKKRILLKFLDTLKFNHISCTPKKDIYTFSVMWACENIFFYWGDTELMQLVVGLGVPTLIFLYWPNSFGNNPRIWCYIIF